MKMDISPEIMAQVEDVKKTVNGATKQSKMKELRDIAKELHEVGYFTDEEYSDCLVGIGDILGFHFEMFKK